MIGIESTIPGKNIGSAHPSDFAFSSQDQALAVPVLGLSFSDTTPYIFPDNPAAPGSGQTTRELFRFQHGLNYTPVSLVYVFYNFIPFSDPHLKDNSYLLTPAPLTGGDFVSQWIQYYVDDQNLVIYYEIDSGGITYVDVTGMELTFKYYVFSNLLE